MFRSITPHIILLLFFSSQLWGQANPIYEKLPVGKYAVGFKIITLTDPSRIVQPEYNYLGEKNAGDRSRKITIHIWYPAKTSLANRKLRFEEYCYNQLLSSTNETLDNSRKEEQIEERRRSVERWFGKPGKDDWKKLRETSMLAQSGALAVAGKFPLLIGMLRPLSTSVTNELLASNGYIVAMIQQRNFSSFAESTLDAIPDMRLAITFLSKNTGADTNKIGTFGFSGSGFSQVLFAMNEYRIKAVADIESGIYMEGLYQNFSASNYYKPTKLRAPFLHIFSRDLSKQEKFIDEFEVKTKFAKRYRLLLNQPALHHWDFAAEGYTACIFLNNRGGQRDNIRRSFEVASLYLLNFFDAELKNNTKARDFLSTKPALAQTESSLWDITILNAKKPPPDLDELEHIIGRKGIAEALEIVRSTIREDTLSDIMQWFNLNRLGYKFVNERNYENAIAIFKLNTELHPGDPNLFDSLAEAYERAGDIANAKKSSATVTDLLATKTVLSDAEKGLKENAEKRLKQ